MILREIAITAPFRAKGPIAELEDNSRVICRLLMKSIGRKIRIDPVWKISIRVNHVNEAPRMQILDGVLVVYRDVDVGRFQSLTQEQKKEFLISLLEGVLGDVGAKFGIDPPVISDAAESVRRSDLVNHIVSKRWAKSPSGRRRARIECEQRFDVAELYVAIEEEGRSIGRRLVATERPDEFVFDVWFNRLEWIDEWNIRVTGAHGKSADVALAVN